jgi:hypothetical protein
VEAKVVPGVDGCDDRHNDVSHEKGAQDEMGDDVDGGVAGCGLRSGHEVIL